MYFYGCVDHTSSLELVFDDDATLKIPASYYLEYSLPDSNPGFIKNRQGTCIQFLKGGVFSPEGIIENFSELLERDTVGNRVRVLCRDDWEGRVFVGLIIWDTTSKITSSGNLQYPGVLLSCEVFSRQEETEVLQILRSVKVLNEKK